MSAPRTPDEKKAELLQLRQQAVELRDAKSKALLHASNVAAFAFLAEPTGSNRERWRMAQAAFEQFVTTAYFGQKS